MKSTAYYDQNADALFNQYDELNADDVHRAWASTHLPEEPGFACDIGAGSGRDANWLAEKGWEVVAVEPSAMREKAAAAAHSRVTWLNDALPGLNALRALGRRFDLILLSAVWMHVAPKDRERAFRILSELLSPSGLLVITLRKGEDEHENAARGFHPTSADELIGCANQRAVAFKGRTEADDLLRAHVRWEALVFEMPDDGTGTLPLLRHVIVNDDKSSTYKLGLLRVLVRIAESAPGVVIKRTDEYVEIPFGVVGLYWIKQYRNLVDRGMAQLPGNKTGYGWAKSAFYQLRKDVSPSDLRLGAHFDAARGEIVTHAIRDACLNIRAMPAKHITEPGSSNVPIFHCDYKSVRRPSNHIVLSREYLAKFGSFRVPHQLWQTLGQYACWLDPVIVKEWSQLMMGWGVAESRSSGVSVFDWHESPRTTRVAIERAGELRNNGFDLTCVWSGSSIIRSSLAIDHCFPWSRWYNNDLWNLLPTNSVINSKKLDRLPSSAAMSEAREDIIEWWSSAWEHSKQHRERFLVEAEYSLPGLSGEGLSLNDIFQGVLHQRARLKQDQQLVEWNVPRR